MSTSFDLAISLLVCSVGRPHAFYYILFIYILHGWALWACFQSSTMFACGSGERTQSESVSHNLAMSRVNKYWLQNINSHSIPFKDTYLAGSKHCMLLCICMFEPSVVCFVVNFYNQFSKHAVSPPGWTCGCSSLEQRHKMFEFKNQITQHNDEFSLLCHVYLSFELLAVLLLLDRHRDPHSTLFCFSEVWVK